ncbi:MAG: hypothetical protein NT015_17425 [Alphaproteobacteria bacterium]|nr:hypothetical protein [Alphaproteobacteria bacterium]
MRVYLASTALALIALATPALGQTPDGGAPAPAATAPAAPSEADLERRVIELLQQELRRCWRMPTDQPDPDRLAVTVEFNLNTDGSLNGQPRVASPRNYTFDPPMAHAAQAALAAVRACAPYTVFANDPLLRDHHEVWSQVSMTFRPSTERPDRGTRPFDPSEAQELVNRHRNFSGEAQYIRPPETIEEEVVYELRMHMARCRERPARGMRRISVVLGFDLNRNGTIRGRPRVVLPENYRRNRETRAAVERTIAELRQCAPFPFATNAHLAERYDLWDRINLRLDAAVETPAER